MKKIILGILAVGVVVGVGWFLTKREPSENTSLPFPPEIHEYYWGDGCPHCAVVAEFFETWEQPEELVLEKYEVWNDKNNAKNMRKRGVDCKIPANQLGVPFMVTPGGDCLIGEVQVIGYFEGYSK